MATKENPLFERWMTRIQGDLVCQKCKGIIRQDAIEADYYSQSEGLMFLVRSHFCGKIFNYDFNDPRTIKEQQSAQQLKLIK